jgi:hypothetical protein
MNDRLNKRRISKSKFKKSEVPTETSFIFSCTQSYRSASLIQLFERHFHKHLRPTSRCGGYIKQGFCDVLKVLCTYVSDIVYHYNFTKQETYALSFRVGFFKYNLWDLVYPDGFQDHLLQTLTLSFRRLPSLNTALHSRKYYARKHNEERCIKGYTAYITTYILRSVRTYFVPCDICERESTLT